MTSAPRAVTPVGIAVEQLTEVLALIDAAGQVDVGAVRDGVAQAHRLLAGLDPYLEENAGPEPPALAALAARTRGTDWTRQRGTDGALLEQEMLSGHVEGQLLQMLVRATGAQRVLEIGMFTGYSALAMAEALPPEGRLVTCELDPFAAALARQCFGRSMAGALIDIRLGPALETLRSLAQERARFDLVFIDADKTGYLGYLHALLDDDLLTPGALMCVDNTLMQGEPWSADAQTPNGAAIARFNQVVADDPRLDQVLIPVRDGLTLIRRRLA